MSDKVKEKAKELVEKFMEVDGLGYQSNNGLSEWSSLRIKEQAKACAIICVDEIINLCAYGLSETKFWQQVKEAIKSL